MKTPKFVKLIVKCHMYWYHVHIKSTFNITNDVKSSLKCPTSLKCFRFVWFVFQRKISTNKVKNVMLWSKVTKCKYLAWFQLMLIGRRFSWEPYSASRPFHCCFFCFSEKPTVSSLLVFSQPSVPGNGLFSFSIFRLKIVKPNRKTADQRKVPKLFRFSFGAECFRWIFNLFLSRCCVTWRVLRW